MADVLIRGLAAESVARIDAAAAALGISRNEYLRRKLEGDRASDQTANVTMDDLRRASESAADLMDPDVMENAWR